MIHITTIRKIPNIIVDSPSDIRQKCVNFAGVHSTFEFSFRKAVFLLGFHMINLINNDSNKISSYIIS